MKIIYLLLMVALTSCSSSTGSNYRSMAESDRDRAFRLGAEQGTPENIAAIEVANKRSQENTRKAKESDDGLFDILFELLAK